MLVKELKLSVAEDFRVYAIGKHKKPKGKYNKKRS